MNAIEQQTEKLAGDLKRLIYDSEAMIEATTDAVGDKAREVRARLRETLDGAARNCRTLEEKTLRSAKTANRLVRQHPYESLGVALGIGFVVGIFSARRC
jgi:ElaB/YqjD/DUF883 family membrane-anchored ribosome-binding protein